LTTYEEWRVTGIWEGEAYSFTWSPVGPPAWEFPEREARSFMAHEWGQGAGNWQDGPHLHKRTVTVTDWEEA